MSADNLVRMANRIGLFFAAMPHREEAIDDIAQHLRKFWEPRMRKQFLAHVDEHGGEGLDPIVMEAVSTHRALLEGREPAVPAAAGGDAG